MSAVKKKSKGISDKIRPVGEIPVYTTALVYGESGTGKTAFAATFPKPILLLDIREKGTETISKMKDIDVLPIDTWQDFEEAFWMCDSGTRYATIVLDQITSLQGVAMDKIRTDNEMEATDTFTKRDWGQISGLMQTWLMNYRNLWDKKLHVCFVAHQRQTIAEEAEDDQIEPSIGARLMPSVASFLNGAVSVIGNTFIRERYIKDDSGEKIRRVDYCMRIGPHAVYRSKIRVPPGSVKVPDVLVNPSFEKVMKLSRGESLAKSPKKR